jgi:hypothetical protein
MPEMHQSEPAASGLPPQVLAPSWSDDSDYALGCECAYPTLQIERWGLEASGSSVELS